MSDKAFNLFIIIGGVLSLATTIVIVWAIVKLIQWLTSQTI